MLAESRGGHCPSMTTDPDSTRRCVGANARDGLVPPMTIGGG